MYTLVTKLKELTGQEISQRDADVLVDKFSEKALLLQNGNLTKAIAQKLIMQIKNYVRTSTNLKIDSHGYRFNGLLSGVLGQASTIICSAFNGTTVYCAKLGSAATITREVNVAKIIKASGESPFLMPIITDFPIDAERHCMISPLYAMPLSTLVALHPKGIRDPIIIKNILTSMLQALKCFEKAKYCHADIKPANIMACTHGHDGGLVLIDYGSAVPYGEMIQAYTAAYALDVAPEGSLQFDLTCLASTIFQVLLGSLPQPKGVNLVNDLREAFLYGFEEEGSPKLYFPQKQALVWLLEDGATVDGVISRIQ